MASMAGNLALSYGRLGDYNLQLEWANRAPDAWGADFGGFVEVQLAYSKGMSYGMRGRAKEVEEAITALERRMEKNLPPWIQQAWHLWKADLLMLLSKRPEALAAARAAVTSFGGLPLTNSFIGAFDRWLAATAQPGNERDEAGRLIAMHVGKISEFDSVDQIEILCAAWRIARAGAEQIQAEGALVERVRFAPSGLTALLSRLGFIQV